MKCDIMTTGAPCSRCKGKPNAKCELFPSKRRHGRELNLPIGYRQGDSSSSRQSPDRAEPDPSFNAQSASDSLRIHEEPRTPQVHTDSTDTLQSSADDNDNDELSKNPGADYMIDSPSMLMASPLTRQLGQFANLPSALGPLSPFASHYPTDRPYNNGPPSMLLSLSRDSKGRETLEFVIERARRGHTIGRETLSFVGESSPLSMLLRRFQDSGHVSMNPISHKGVPNGQCTPESDNTASSVADSVASCLVPGALEDLIEVYFTVVHPFYPFINRRLFAEKFINNCVPPLLLNAVCFAACHHCEPAVFHRSGFGDRQEAKMAFYSEAKRLFDEDNEDDILVILQSAVLLSFYGGKPRRVWNNRSWLAIAVNIVEDMGGHRSTVRSCMNDTDKSQIRIIWWCLITRDIMTSLTLGRPQKICDLRCDADLLTLEDFDRIDKDPDGIIFGRADRAYHHLLIESAKANTLMMKVFSARYDPRSDPQLNMTEYERELAEWKKNLPPCVNWNESPSSIPAIYMSMIYHHLVIFIFRPRMIDSEVIEDCSLEHSTRSATEIAGQLAKLAVKGTLSIPQDIYSIFVTAMVILIVDLRSNGSIVSKLQLQICMMTLNQAKESWDHAKWLVNMFGRMIEGESEQPASGARSPTGYDANSDMDLLKSLFAPMVNDS